jgi:ribosomal protein L37AE/L43A
MMVTCPECGKSISSQAHPCPQCGYPFAGFYSKEQAEELLKFHKRMISEKGFEYEKYIKECRGSLRHPKITPELKVERRDGVAYKIYAYYRCSVCGKEHNEELSGILNPSY